MATKEDLGTRKKCFTCKGIMVCKETEYEGKVKYQWQNDDGTAHYGFNQETQKSYCKSTPQEDNTKGIDFEKLIRENALKSDSLRKVYDAHKEELVYPEVMVIYLKVLKDCEIMGITEPQVIGMMFNNTIRRLGQ